MAPLTRTYVAASGSHHDYIVLYVHVMYSVILYVLVVISLILIFGAFDFSVAKLHKTHEITNFINKSPGCDAIFKLPKEEMGCDSPGIRVLCPTRWTVRADALKSTLDNFSVFLEFWADSLECVMNTEMKARIQGVAAQMMKLDYFGFSLLTTLAKQCRGHTYQQLKVKLKQFRLKDLTYDAGFDLFWKKITASAEYLDVDNPALSRCKAPCRLDDDSMPAFHVAVEDHYRFIYFESLDLITSCIKDRFNQPGYQTYAANHMNKSYASFSPFM